MQRASKWVGSSTPVKYWGGNFPAAVHRSRFCALSQSGYATPDCSRAAESDCDWGPHSDLCFTPECPVAHGSEPRRSGGRIRLHQCRMRGRGEGWLHHRLQRRLSRTGRRRKGRTRTATARVPYGNCGRADVPPVTRRTHGRRAPGNV